MAVMARYTVIIARTQCLGSCDDEEGQGNPTGRRYDTMKRNLKIVKIKVKVKSTKCNAQPNE